MEQKREERIVDCIAQHEKQAHMVFDMDSIQICWTTSAI